ncbi:hypothetical protein BDN71DRAFT_1457157 [Pleurotus eryngii]|uniref:DUF2461 domain-containing protein n=1 Tax=Pleurotus eryngii TaxID=5323 RepID=A0A9P5ZJC8_PLEER|nr:hypothetical protein BDN71DRAFT_1457157 [Pleurotus eryngii]
MAARSPQKKARPVKQESGPLRRASTRKSIQRTSVPENDVSSAAEASEAEAQVSKRAPKLDQKKRTTPRKAPSKRRREETPEEHTDDDDTADDPKEYDSDALDDDSDDLRDLRGTKTKSKKASSSPRKRRRTKVSSDDPELAEGQEIIGKVVEAPKTGHVPAGQISGNTLNFLRDLKKPECNDRQWFKLHEPVYRAAEKEWKAFVESFTDLLAEVDAQVPHLPPNDVVHRIYRDIRFSNDKTPYKTGFSASFSRSGRKGIFAGYHIAVIPGGESLIAAGSWCPGKNELAAIRANILRNPNRLRQVISEPEFVEWFGAAERPPDGERSNIFGMEDELKVAPKGIDKNHKDIDLLKCRSFAVVHRFLDTEVLDPEFKNKLADVARVMMPFVHCLNDMMTLPPDDNDGDEDQAEQGSGHGSE